MLDFKIDITRSGGEFQQEETVPSRDCFFLFWINPAYSSERKR